MNFKTLALELVIPVLACALLAPVSHAQTPLNFSKAFSPQTIGPGSTSKLSFAIVNPSGVPVTDIAFVDTLPAGVTIADASAAISGCGGTIDASGGGSTITFTGGAVGGGQSCEISVNVTSLALGTHTNITGDLTSSGGNSGTATADLTVTGDRPGFFKSFSPSTIGFGQRSTLTFTIDNSLNPNGVLNLAFTDTLPAGLVIANPANASSDCGGTLSAVPGSGEISLGFSFPSSVLAAGDGCAVSVDVVGGVVGQHANTSGELTSAPGPFGGLSRSSGLSAANLTVTNNPIILTKTFTNDPVAPGSVVDLEFMILAVSRGDISNISFTDDLDAVITGLRPVAGQLPWNDICGPGSVLEVDENGVLSLTGGNLEGGQGLVDENGNPLARTSCNFSIQLEVPSGVASGFYPNSTSAITGDSGGSPVSGSAASDLLSVQGTAVLTKTFTPSTVGPGGTTTLEFTLTNSSGSAVSDISFSDNLVQFYNGIVVTSALPIVDPCGSGSSLTVVQIGAEQNLLFSGGSLPAGGSCDFSVDLQLPQGGVAGTFVNTIDNVISTAGGVTAVGPAATGSLTVAPVPRIKKEFDGPIAPGGTGVLTFEISLEDTASGSATEITFTDDLDAALAGLVVTDSLPIIDVCGIGSELGGTAGNLSLTDGTLAPGETCTFSVNVAVPATAVPGTYTNTTSSLTATVSGVSASSLAASADLLVSGLTLTKDFTDDPVNPGDTVTLEFTLTNTHPTEPATGIGFTDPLSAALSGLVSISGQQTDICGTGSSLSGTSSLIFSGGSLNAGESCTFSVTLQVPAGADPISYVNVTSDLSATIDGSPVVLPGAIDTLLLTEPEEEVEETIPTVSVNQAAGQADPTNMQPILFTAVFSESVTGFENGDPEVTYPGLTAPTVVVTEVAPLDGTTYQISVSGLTDEGLVNVNIPAGVASGAFFPNQASTSTDNVVQLTTSRGDTTPPVITLTGDSAVTLERCSPPYVDPGATVVDDVDPSVTVVVGGDTVDTNTEGVYVITYDATDAAGNAAIQVTRTVTVEDSPPVITLTGAHEVVLECGVDSYVEEGATAVDLCDGDVSVVIGGDTVDTTTAGAYVVTYNATDSGGNAADEVTRTVIVEDSTPPVIMLTGAAEVVLECGVDSYVEEGATANDLCDGEFSVVIGGDTVDTTTPGTYVVTYNATDSAGNAADEVTRTVIVEDTTPPQIALEGEDVVCVIQDEPFVDPGVTVTDACDPDPDVVVDPDSVDTSSVGEIEVTYTATDDAGLSSHVTRTIKVIPRFATIEGIFGTKQVDIKNSSVVDGGEGEKTLHLVASQKEVNLLEGVYVGGNVVSVTGDTELKTTSSVDGNLDAGGDVDLKEQSAVGGDVTSGGDVDLKADASVGGSVIAAGTVKLGNGATIGAGPPTEGAGTPPLPVLPDILLPELGLTAGEDDVDVPQGASQLLGAGSYGDVRLRKDSMLTLDPTGTYHFESFTADENASIVFSGPAIINVVDKIDFKSDVQMTGADASEILIQCGGKSIKLDRGSYLGTFLAPDADIQLKAESTLTGALFGESIDVKELSTVIGVIALDQIIAAAQNWPPPSQNLELRDYKEWAASYGITDNAGDEDSDGFTNEIEFMLSFDPIRVDAAPQPFIDRSDGRVTWSLPLRQGLDENSLGVMLPSIEVSRDLIHWERPEALGLSQQLEGTHLEVSGPLGAKSLYLRFGVGRGESVAPVE